MEFVCLDLLWRLLLAKFIFQFGIMVFRVCEEWKAAGVLLISKYYALSVIIQLIMAMKCNFLDAEHLYKFPSEPVRLSFLPVYASVRYIFSFLF